MSTLPGKIFVMPSPKTSAAASGRLRVRLVTGNYPGELAVCAQGEGWFCTRLDIQMADDATEKGQYQKALALYLKATRS
jgi:hypothetical protein